MEGQEAGNDDAEESKKEIKMETDQKDEASRDSVMVNMFTQDADTAVAALEEIYNVLENAQDIIVSNRKLLCFVRFMYS